MKKVLFTITIIFLMTFTVHASSPAIIMNVIETNGDLNINSEIKLTSWIVKGNQINYLGNNNCKEFKFNTETFTFVSFESVYDFKFDHTTNCIYNDSVFGFTFPQYLSEEKDIRPLWTITLKLNTDLNNETFKINDADYNKSSLKKLAVQDGPYDNNYIQNQYQSYDYNLTNEKIIEYKNEYEEIKKDYIKKENNTSESIETPEKKTTKVALKRENTNKKIKDTNSKNSNLPLIMTSLIILIITLIIAIIILRKKASK